MLKWILSTLMIFAIGCEKITGQDIKVINFPKYTSDLAKTSVKILNKGKSSGGSGVIWRSDETGSKILTNKHVCSVIQTGGIVKTQYEEVNIASYKVYTKHDLCLINVKRSLGINLIMPETEPAQSNDINVSGHPSLLPHVRANGHLSEKRVISVMVDIAKCDGSEKGEDYMYCVFLGGKPVIQDFDSQLVSSLIMPGSSGSAVFTKRGELTGVVFAGSGDGLSYGSIVPFTYVRDFLTNESKYEAVVPDRKGKPKDFFKMLDRGRELCATRNPKFRKLCSRIRFQPIWVNE